MTHTSHKSESSIRQYTSKCPPKKQREMSAALAKSLQSDDNDDVQIETVAMTAIPKTWTGYKLTHRIFLMTNLLTY